jgi:predicted metal-binding membrane protein
MTERLSSATSAAALMAAALAAWIALAAYEPPMGAAGFLVGWTLMMAAMMLPSAAPLVLLYRGSTALLLAGYLAVWAAIGLLPYAAMRGEVEVPAAVVLGLAGVYQLTPLKTACLRRCRGAADFLMRRWRHGPLRLGAEHGLYCVGCCVGLMAVLVLAAAMSLAWAAALAVLVFVEKVLQRGEGFARATGVALLVLAAVKGATWLTGA